MGISLVIIMLSVGTVLVTEAKKSVKQNYESSFTLVNKMSG